MKFLDIAEQGGKMVSFDFDQIFQPAIVSAFCVVILLIILSIIINICSKKYIKDPLKTPKGIFNLAVILVTKIEGLVVEVMGERNRKFAMYMVPLMCYVFISFIWGLTGMTSPMSYFGVPLSLALITFIMIHVTAIKTNHWKYFKRYIDPLPVFLPINLITMWAPLLSLSLRMFGNAIAGYCLMAIVYYGFENLSNIIIMGVEAASSVGGAVGPQSIILAPLVTPILHAYFDLFSGFIQTFVFSLLTMINIYQEQITDDEPETRVKEIQYQ
jgi:F-type H+-transporting ATPase subunit a